MNYQPDKIGLIQEREEELSNSQESATVKALKGRLRGFRGMYLKMLKGDDWCLGFLRRNAYLCRKRNLGLKVIKESDKQVNI